MNKTIRVLFMILFFAIAAFCAGQATTGLYASVYGKTGGIISKSEVVRFSELRLMTNKDSLYKIISFHLGITGPGTEYIDCVSNSNKLTDKMKDVLLNVRSFGAKIIFYEITCVGITKDTIVLPDINFITQEQSSKGK